MSVCQCVSQPASQPASQSVCLSELSDVYDLAGYKVIPRPAIWPWLINNVYLVRVDHR
jgi:hypothetical protein